jgi:hypothetical protein
MINWLFMETYFNPILRCLLCPFLLVARCLNCICYSQRAKELERERAREEEIQKRLEEVIHEPENT